MMMKDKKILYLGLHPQGDVTHYPIIKIHPRPLEELLPFFQTHEKWTHVILTSRESTRIFFQIAKTLKMQNKIFVVIGEGTKGELKRYGNFQTHVADEEHGEGVVALLKTLDLKNAFLFFPHSSKARSLILDFLKDYPSLCLPLYDTLPNKELPPLDLENFEEIVFTSSSTVEAFYHLFGKFPKNKRLTTIGPITQKALDKFLKFTYRED